MPSRTREVNIKPKFRPIGDVKRYKSFVFYGRASSGKTTLSCSFPTPILLLDVNDEGTDSVSDMDDEDLQVWDIEDGDDLDDAIAWLKRNPKAFATVVCDTVTMMQTKQVEEISGKSLAKTGKYIGDWGTMTKQQWGQVASWMKTRITRLRNLPMYVVFTAQQRTFNLDTDDEDVAGLLDPEVGPSLSPSVMSHLCAAVGVIGHCYIRVKKIKKKDDKGKLTTTKRYEYCLRVGPSDIYATKVRKPKRIKLPEVIVDPEFEDLIAMIQGE